MAVMELVIVGAVSMFVCCEYYLVEFITKSSVCYRKHHERTQRQVKHVVDEIREGKKHDASKVNIE